MTTSTHLYGQLINRLRQHSHACDLRHLKALAWMVSALLCSGQLSLCVWEPYVPTRATKAQSTERRWQRFMKNQRISVMAIYLPLALAALSGWKQQRLYLALDTTVLWNRFCMIHLSVVCCGRAIPLLWRVLEHSSSTVAFGEYQPLLRRAHWLLRHHRAVMLLADRWRSLPQAWICQSRVDEVVKPQSLALLLTLTVRCLHSHLATLPHDGRYTLSPARTSSTVSECRLVARWQASLQLSSSNGAGGRGIMGSHH